VGPVSGGLRYVVVEGPIGVGKTTLARRLAQSLHGNLLEEAPEQNAFLERFYLNPRAWALPAQLSFLLQRVEQLSGLFQADLFAPLWVADFMLEKDRLFARLNLPGDDLELYERVFRRLVDRSPQPDIVIYLHAPFDVLRARIAARGRAYERSIDPAYLQNLAAAYAAFFSTYDRTRLLVVNAADADFVGREDHYRHLLERLGQPEPRRQFFDPPLL